MSNESNLCLRVAALERQNSQLRRFVGLATLCAVSLPVLAAFAPAVLRAPDEIKAERFVLVDAQGKERAALEMESQKTPRLVLRDPEGGERLSVAVDPQTAYVLLKDDQGKNRLGLAVDAFPHLMMHDADQVPRIHASVGIQGASSILFSDGKGFPLGLGIDSKGMSWRKPEIDEQMKAEAAAGTGKKPPVVPPAEDEGAGKKKDG